MIYISAVNATCYLFFCNFHKTNFQTRKTKTIKHWSRHLLAFHSRRILTISIESNFLRGREGNQSQNFGKIFTLASFADYTFLRYFWVKRTKNYSCNGEFFEILVFILVIGVFLSGILRVCCFDTNHPVLLGWFVDIFYPSSVYFLQFLPFGYFLGGKWTKIFLVLVNALKFWYLFKWFGLFYLEFCAGVFFLHNWPFSFVWFVDIFHPLRVNCLKLSPSWDFILVKMDKKLL